MHPSSSSNSSANTQQPWQFDESIYPDIIAEQNVQDDRPYRLIKGGPLDYKRVQKLYDDSPIPGYTIALVEVIYDQRIQERFEVELSILEQRANKSAAAPFQSTWKDECSSDEEKKTRQHVLNHLVRRSQTPLGYRDVKVVSMFHATKQTFLDSIFRVGFTMLAKKEGSIDDPGYFGKGFYHTSYAEYAYRVYGSDNILLFNWVSYFAVYPVVDKNGEWLDTLAGKEHYKNYDAHYVLVNSLNPNDPNENSYVPIQNIQKHTYDELVTFQSNQILPRYIVHLEPTGLNLKQVSTKTDSMFGSIMGWFSTKIELTVNILIQEINNYLKSQERNEVEKSLSQSTKQALGTGLKRKIDALSKKDPKTPLVHEEAWMLRQLLCIQKNKNEKIAKLLLNELCARIIPQDKKLTFLGLLQSYYMSKNSIPRLFKAPLHIEHNYVQVVLVDEQGVLVGEQEEKKTRKPLVSSKEITSKFMNKFGPWVLKKDPKKRSNPSENISPSISLTDLFEKKGKDSPKHLAIIGRAGIGKSTLCQYICYQWANGNLWNDKYEALIWIPLRQLINVNEEDSLYDVIRRFCILPSGRKEISADHIKEYLFQREDKVLFILDGYDEISGSLKDGSLISDLMQELLQQKHTLITSRLHAVQDLKVDRTFENVGFSSSHVNEYIAKNLPPNESRLLQSQLKKQTWLSGIAHVPLNLELICSTWEGTDKDLFATISSLYLKFTLDLLKRFLLRRGITSASRWELADFEAKYSAELQFLEHLAWEGLVQKKLIMPIKNDEYHKIYLKHRPKDPEERPDFDKTILEMGFVRTSGSFSVLSEQELEFSHLTFQEFFAAKYICRCLSNKNISAVKELIQWHKFNPQFQLVWSFAAGILKDQPEKLRLYFRLLDETIDLAGFSGFRLKMRCLEEARWSENLPDLDKDLQTALDWFQWVKLIPKFIDDAFLECLKINIILNRKLAEKIDFFSLSSGMVIYLSGSRFELTHRWLFNRKDNPYNLSQFRKCLSNLINIRKINEDDGIEILTVFFQNCSESNIYTHAAKLVFEHLSDEEQKKYATMIFQSLVEGDLSVENTLRELISTSGLLETLVPQLLKSIQKSKPKDLEYGSSALLLGMSDGQLLDRYPEIVSTLLRALKQNVNKQIHYVVFEGLVSLLFTQSKDEQIYLFFLRVLNDHQLATSLFLLNDISLVKIIKALEKSITSNHQNVNLVEKIFISLIRVGLNKHDAQILRIIAIKSSRLLKKIGVELLFSWLKDQVHDHHQGASDDSCFLNNLESFYWNFSDLNNKKDTFYNDIKCAMNHCLDSFLDMVVTTFENENNINLFRILRLLSSFNQEFAIKLYSKKPEKIRNLLFEALGNPNDAATATALLGLISRNEKLTPDLMRRLGDLFKANYDDPKYPHSTIAEYNLFAFAHRTPQFVHEILPLLSNRLNSQNGKIHREASWALKNAFWKDPKHSKEIGEALFTAFKQKKIQLYVIREVLLEFIGLYPAKKQEVLSEVLQDFKEENLDETSSILTYIGKTSKQRNHNTLEFSRNIYFLYELLLKNDISLEHEKQHILNNLLALMTCSNLNSIDYLMDCFVGILFSEPESPIKFVKHCTFILVQSGLIEDFIDSCANIKRLREDLHLPPITEKIIRLIIQTIYLALKYLKVDPGSFDVTDVVMPLHRIMKLYPKQKGEVLNFFNSSQEKLLAEFDKRYKSNLDISFSSVIKEWNLKSLFFKDKGWRAVKTPFTYLLDQISRKEDHTKNDFELLRSLCCGGPEVFIASSIPDLIARIEQNDVNRENYLRVLLLICIREGIGLFMIGDEVCFYKNGLHKHKVSDPQWFSKTSQDISRTLLKDLTPDWDE